MKLFYAYPCGKSCVEFLEDYKIMGFKEVCQKHCDRCPDCVVLDIPYSDDMEKKIRIFARS